MKVRLSFLHAGIFLACFTVLVACSDRSPSVTAPPSGGRISATPVLTPSPALAVTVTPNFDQSFRQVAGRAPFTVTFGITVTNGMAPYQVAWDFDGDGKPDSTQFTPQPFVFTKPGVYTTTVTVQDRAGARALATRRIVAFATPRLPTWQYGVTAHFERRRTGYYPTLDDVSRAAALAQAARIQVARIDFNWDMLNPNEGQWNFDDYDAMVSRVRAHNLDILAIVDYTSWWASSAQDSNDWRVRLYSEPRSPDVFARFTYELVSHFKNEVHAWEIWNEPNTSGFWKPQPNAAHYTQLLQEAYLAVKYADPQAVVVFGGLSGNGVDGDDKDGWASNFIANAYAAGAQNYFDVMAIHPYILPNSGIAALRAKIAAPRAVMDQQGDSKVPLWLTEIGAPNDAPWWPTAPIQTQDGVAAWLGQVYTQLWDQAPVIFWYDLQDQSIGDEVEQNFGLLRVDFSAKPAYDKLKALAGSK